MEFTPIGHVRGGGNYPYEAPRQGCLATETGRIELEPHRNFEAAAADLAGFERIWVIFLFDRASGWRPKVQPPVAEPKRRYGVFATRSPHRPNPIGISAVRLLGVDGLRLDIAEFDMLDGTPVLDIKPYIPDADAFPGAATGWRARVPAVCRTLEFAPGVLETMRRLADCGAVDLERVCRTQLATLELDPARQRLECADPAADRWILACRTWRIGFRRDAAKAGIVVESIASGYSPEELAGGAPDPYGDKALHRRFAEETIR